MQFKHKVIGTFLLTLLYGCSGNSSDGKVESSSDIKRFSGVVNNSSVTDIDVDAIPIGKHGQFRLNDNNQIDAIVNSSNSQGRYGFSIEERSIGPYVIIATAPDFNAETESTDAAKMSCQVATGCDLKGDGSKVGFGQFYSVKPKRQWGAAVESVSNGQFVVVNPITEMARVFGFSSYVNDRSSTKDCVFVDGVAAESCVQLVDGSFVDISETSVAQANYYSNYAIVKSNTQTADLLGLADILSTEPANLTLLHTLDVNASNGINDSIRYGALLAGWQQLELAFDQDVDVTEGDPAFQQKVVVDFLENRGQLYKASAQNGQQLTLKAWYQAALDNLIAARQYHSDLGRRLPEEVQIVINELQQQVNGLNGLSASDQSALTEAQPVTNELYEIDYTDAVAKTKAMVNYIIDLENTFATAEFREGIKTSSKLIDDEVRRLSPSFDKLFKVLLLTHDYYVSCTNGGCVEPSYLSETFTDLGAIKKQEAIAKQTAIKAWWDATSKTYDATNKTVRFTDADTLTTLVLGQEIIFDAANPESSGLSNTHDLLISGSLQFDGLRLELTDLNAENADNFKSSLRFSFREKLAQLPEPPKPLAGGKGITENENLVPDFMELVLPKFKLYDSATLGFESEFKVSGSFTALMIANTDIDDFVENKPETEKLGKRFNLSNVKATLELSGKRKGATTNVDGETTELRDNALFFIDAAASESFVFNENTAAYYPDTKYPSFESFFKPREGFEKGSLSPEALVTTKKGTMKFPDLSALGEINDQLDVDVEFIEIDYALGGLQRFIAYPKKQGESEYWGLICSVREQDKTDPILQGDGYLTAVLDENDSPILDENNAPVLRPLFVCSSRDRYDGEANPDSFINKVYSLSKNVVSLVELNGRGSYRINFPTTNNTLNAFPQVSTDYFGTLERPIVLGVDSMRLQFKPNLVDASNSAFMPESVLDISLVWRTRDVIDVNAFLAFDTERVINNPNGSGLPYLAVGSDSESYSIAYRTDASGNESGEYVMTWRGVKFVDGSNNSLVMERTFNEDEKEGVFAGIGSNVTYGENTGVVDSKCGFFGRGNEPVVGEKCDAIAYFTFRGLVTGSLREERDGVYVIRYIDGSFQILGGGF